MFKRIVSNLIRPKIRGVSINDIQTLQEELIFPQETFKLAETLDIFGQTHHHFSSSVSTIPPFYVRSVNNAKCIVGKEEVFTINDEVIIEHTSQKINPWVGGINSKLHKPYKVNGSVVNLALSGLENNYYHWLTECLGRYYLLEKSKFKPDFYILSKHLNFQKQYLDLLNIDKSRIIEIDSDLVIQADEIIIPSFINSWESIEFRGCNSFQKQWLPSWIGNIYRENINFTKSRVNKNKIYISRAFANYRKIENEDEIIDLLKSKGYGIHYLENMSVQEQIELFSNASIVLGLHGAGFSNIYFCPTNATICEFFTEYYHDSSFRILTSALGLKYQYIIGKTNNIKNVHPQKENVYIDLAQLEMVLKILEG